MRYSTASGRWVIGATVLGSGMASIDATVVGIALPSIGRQLHTGLGPLQWVVSGYTLTLAALLLPGGALGDQLGRRRIFSIGVAWFAVASAGCALAPNVGTLIGMRLLQGVGAALLTPGSLAIIQASFEERDRGRAIGAWSGLGGVATAAGPLLGGYLIAAASWRWIFVINVPLGAAVLYISMRRVPESSDPDASRHVDATGATLAMLTLVGLTYGLIEGPNRHWTNPAVLTALVGGAVAAIAFVLYEGTTEAPMMPLTVLRVRQFTVTNAVTFVVYAALGGVLFLLPVELQVVDKYSPFESGVSLLPLTIMMLVLSAQSGRLAARIGPRLQMSVGPVVVASGVALLSRASQDRSYVTGVLPAVLLFGLGLAITVAPLTATAMSSLAEEHSGLASAVNNDVARLGGLIAVSVLPALAGITGSAYLHPGALSAGFRTAVYIAAAWCAAGGIIAAIGIRNRAALPQPPAELGAGREQCLHCALDATPLSRRD
jgi:EmrB/QacA subfamily drug resistance transporter